MIVHLLIGLMAPVFLYVACGCLSVVLKPFGKDALGGFALFVIFLALIFLTP